MTIRTTYRNERLRTRAPRKNARRVSVFVSFPQVGRGVPAEPRTSALAYSLFSIPYPFIGVATSHQPQATSYYYVHDGNKNVSALVAAQPAQPAQPALLASYVYAPFGAVTSSSGTLAAANPFRFSSEYHDDLLSFVYYNYRHYNPGDGRWMSRDRDNGKALPLENAYIFSQNMPVSRFDVIGLDDWGYLPADIGLRDLEMRQREGQQRLEQIGGSLKCIDCPTRKTVAAYISSPPFDQFDVLGIRIKNIDVAGRNASGEFDSGPLASFRQQAWIAWDEMNSEMKKWLSQGVRNPRPTKNRCRIRATCVKTKQCSCGERICHTWEERSKGVYLYGLLKHYELAGRPFCSINQTEYNRMECK